MKKAKEESYHQYIRHKWLILSLLILLAISIGIFSLMSGSASMSLSDVLWAITGRGDMRASTIIWNVRMPRLAAAAVVGIALSMSGCIMQNVLRNPLASASTLGVSQGASFGAAAAIIFLGAGTQNYTGNATALTITQPYMVSLSAFAGGMATTLAILTLSRKRNSSPVVLVLAGVALSAMFSGALTLIQYFADDVMVATIVYWTFGNLGRAGLREIGIIGTLDLFAFVFFALNSWNYNALESGHDTAKSLGVNTDILVPSSLAVCALITSVSVAFTGCISFIGLIASHIMRRFVGNDFRFLIPCSSIAGVIILLAADIGCRMIVSPIVLPIGALTSFMGAPLFLYLILHQEKSR